jgi:hypothetical protein
MVNNMIPPLVNSVTLNHAKLANSRSPAYLVNSMISAHLAYFVYKQEPSSSGE